MFQKPLRYDFTPCNARKIIESITLLCNSIKKTKKRKIQTSQTHRFFVSVYIKSRQNDFVYIIKERQCPLSRKISGMNFVVLN